MLLYYFNYIVIILFWKSLSDADRKIKRKYLKISTKKKKIDE